MPELIGLVLGGKIDPGKVFDQTLPLEQVAEGYRGMDERRAIKTLLVPWPREGCALATELPVLPTPLARLPFTCLLTLRHSVPAGL